MDLMDVETQLRSHLAARPALRAPDDLAERTRVRHRRQRRQQAAVVGIGLAVVLVFGSVPVLRGLLPEVGSSDTAAPSRGVTTQSLYDVPVRGPLADDEPWLQAVAALPWRVEPFDPDAPSPTATHRVAWAGDAAGTRIALVLTEVGGRLSGVWFTGPAGAEPGEMTQATGVQHLVRNQPLAFVDVPERASSGVLVVVGLPGDTVEYVDGTTVSAAGEELVDRRPLPGQDGVAAGEISGSRGLANSVRAIVSRNGRELSSMSYVASDRASAIARAPVEGLTDPRGLRARVSEQAVQQVLHMAVSTYGTGLDGATATLLAAGPTDGPGEVVLAGFTFRSGATVLVSGSTQRATNGSTTSSMSTLDPQPAGTPLTDQLLAVPLDGELALSGPRDAVRAEVLDTDGTPLTTLSLVDGTGVGSAGDGPAAATVRFLAADDTVLAETPVSETGR
ncbi:hypothetical protein O2W15_06350 [Modestobacter sp. VKM Ac-2979]|uniref:hypothetical protein n=1 Tax=unclassified Modestobacter TaxID=2643866 RepID=UPI0022AB594A|nr:MULTISPECIES: hypothetical protein [unclassified Modestobacter]MCZ2811052.1 hypothetical protein [Modestobacter sp. VKM Ac-2979]MCZ2840565.1 hypothetical protein [Modestobacter sp. VKM Ac-2980]